MLTCSVYAIYSLIPGFGLRSMQYQRGAMNGLTLMLVYVVLGIIGGGGDASHFKMIICIYTGGSPTRIQPYSRELKRTHAILDGVAFFTRV